MIEATDDAVASSELEQMITRKALAEELGMSATDVVTLGKRLGLGKFKASSMITKAQADSIRRSATRRALIHEPQLANEETATPVNKDAIPVTDLKNKAPVIQSVIHRPHHMWRISVLIFMGLLPCIILFSLIFFEGGLKKNLVNYPVWTLLIIGGYESILFFLASWKARSQLRKLVVEEFEHKNSDNFQKLQWLSKREDFEPSSDNKKVKHKTSIRLLKSAGFSGVEGGASFAAIIVLLATLSAVLFTTLAYFMIGTMLNLIDGRGGFLFENNEGFTAALTLLVVLTAAAVVPVYTDLAKTISEQQSIFEEQISSISRNLLLIEQRMDPIWDHYQAITNRFIPEWIHLVDDELEESENINELTVNLRASLRIPELFHGFLERDIGIESYHSEVFSDIAMLLASELGEETENTFLVGSNWNWQLNIEPDSEANWDEIKKRLLDWTQGNEVEQNWSDELGQQISEKIDQRRRELAYRPIITYRLETMRRYTIADFSPPTEWIVSILVGFTQAKIYEDFRKSIDSTILHHLERIKPHIEVADSGLFSLCLKSDISADAFLDDYHLFAALQRDFAKSFDDTNLDDNQKKAIWARELFYGMYFFTCQDSKSARSKSVRTIMKEEVKTLNAQDFFSKLFGDVCELMKSMECSAQPPVERSEWLKQNEQLLLTLNYERSAIHNWIRASQSASRRRRWIELEDAEDQKKRKSFLGIPVIPTRRARLEDLMRHAGVPINDMKRLRLKTLREVVESAEMGRTQDGIENILIKDNQLIHSREQLNKLKQNKIVGQKYHEILGLVQTHCGLSPKEISRLRFAYSFWGDDETFPKLKPENRAFPLMKLFLVELKKSNEFAIKEVGDTDRGMLVQMKRLLLDDFDNLKEWFVHWDPEFKVKDLLHPFTVFIRSEAEKNPEIKNNWTPEVIKRMMCEYANTSEDFATTLKITVHELAEAGLTVNKDEFQEVPCGDKGVWKLEDGNIKWTFKP